MSDVASVGGLVAVLVVAAIGSFAVVYTVVGLIMRDMSRYREEERRLRLRRRK